MDSNTLSEKQIDALVIRLRKIGTVKENKPSPDERKLKITRWVITRSIGSYCKINFKKKGTGYEWTLAKAIEFYVFIAALMIIAGYFFRPESVGVALLILGFQYSLDYQLESNIKKEISTVLEKKD